MSFVITTPAIAVLNSPPPAVTKTTTAPPSKTVAAATIPCSTTNRSLHAALEGLPKQMTEADVSKQVANVAAAMQSDTTCSVAERKEITKAVDSMTTRTVAVAGVDDNEDLVLSIARPGDIPGTILNWKVTYAGNGAGEWRALYAFLFAPRVWPDYTYYSNPTGSTSYQILQRRTRNPFTFVPSIEYVYEGSDCCWKFFKPIAGLGLDLTNPAVHAGFVREYKQNVAFSLGALIFQTRDLNDKYRVNDVITTNLDNSQLTQSVFHVNPYIAISFRFGSSPFSVPTAASTSQP